MNYDHCMDAAYYTPFYARMENELKPINNDYIMLDHPKGQFYEVAVFDRIPGRIDQ